MVHPHGREQGVLPEYLFACTHVESSRPGTSHTGFAVTGETPTRVHELRLPFTEGAIASRRFTSQVSPEFIYCGPRGSGICMDGDGSSPRGWK